MINGSDGSVFPPFVTRDRVLRIFSPDMCRSIYMTYLEDVEVLGVPGYRFITPRDVLEDPRINPENVCYCTHAASATAEVEEEKEEDEFEEEYDEEKEEVVVDPLEKCSKAGVFHLAPCRKGIYSPLT